MGKRQIRIKTTDLPARHTETIGKEVHLILKNNTTFLIKVEKSSQDFIEGRDLKKEVHKISLNDIIEIIIDIKASY